VRADPRRWLAVGILGPVAGLLLAADAVPFAIRVVAATALVLALPGLGLSGALLPDAGLDRAERVAISCGVSMAATIAGAFLLHFLPVGLTALSWGLLLGSVAGGAGLVAWARAPRSSTVGVPRGVLASAPGSTGAIGSRADRSQVGDQAPVGGRVAEGRRPLVARDATTGESLLLGVPAAQAVLLLLAGVLIVGSVGIARLGLTVAPATPFTELWLLPTAGGRTAELGISNHEGREVSYRAVITLDGREIATIPGIDIAAGGSDVRELRVPAAADDEAQLEVRLWREVGEPTGEPYRMVRLTVGGAAVASR
jgi:hypothetical protein